MQSTESERGKGVLSEVWNPLRSGTLKAPRDQTSEIYVSDVKLLSAEYFSVVTRNFRTHN